MTNSLESWRQDEFNYSNPLEETADANKCFERADFTRKQGEDAGRLIIISVINHCPVLGIKPLASKVDELIVNDIEMAAALCDISHTKRKL